MLMLTTTIVTVLFQLTGKKQLKYDLKFKGIESIGKSLFAFFFFSFVIAIWNENVPNVNFVVKKTLNDKKMNESNQSFDIKSKLS